MKKLILLFQIIYIFMMIPLAKANEIELIKGSKAGILMEQHTGEILYKKNIDEKLSPASMTKIMTLLLIFESLDNESIKMTDVLTVDEYSASMGGSQVYLEPNEKITVEEAIKCVCISSANDCAVLLATAIAGSEAQFVNRMNSRAVELGCKNTNFMDSSGLTGANHYTSAKDLALISRELLNKYPEVLEYTSIKEDYIRKDTDSPFWLVNTNKLLSIDGINGLKTGYTTFSGYCITLQMTKNNMSLISVVFGYDTSSKRNSESLELLRYGVANYKLDKIFSKGQVLETIDHVLYKGNIDIVIKEDVYYLTKKADSNDFRHEYTYELKDKTSEIIIYINDKEIYKSSLEFMNIENKKNIFELMITMVKKILIV